ncbi:DNA-processing protein DprA [Hydrogenimonas urashimensis]|uniref:DNA-processing protein DprA n=1 Tax=Hydrogenimonas urashimensis TaxID=2740515 RepID=UPI0019151081|nr:DNA-processing protein DprA [Hydrogenimonas urashimensis]
MVRKVDFPIPELEEMEHYPPHLWYKGNRALLARPKISIVGSRRPLSYTRSAVMQLAAALSRRGIVIVSGAAMGVDALAHRGAGVSNTIAVMGCGLDHRYPAINASLIGEIEEKGLVMSQFEPGFRARGWSFVVRNETVVALGSVLVVAQADRDSGTMRSVAFAEKMGKKIYVLPHRLGESEGTNDLLKEGRAEAIYDIDAFASLFGASEEASGGEDFILYCKSAPSYEEAVKRFGDRLFEAELEGRIAIENGRVILL